MTRPRVFIVQRPAFRRNGDWVDKFDLEPVRHFGDARFLLPPGNLSGDLSAMQDIVRAALRDARMDASDYLLPVGDPVAMCMCVAVALEHAGGVVTLLKWDNRSRAYAPVRLALRA